MPSQHREDQRVDIGSEELDVSEVEALIDQMEPLLTRGP